MSGLPFPKSKPVKDRKILAAYAKANPRCAVDGCGLKAQVHHLRGRRFGDDQSLLGLCAFHHTSWHDLGRETWWHLYGCRLGEENRKKVYAVLKLRLKEEA